MPTSNTMSSHIFSTLILLSTSLISASATPLPSLPETSNSDPGAEADSANRQTSSTTPNSHFGAGQVAAAIIVIVVLISLLGTGVWCILRKRKGSKDTNGNANGDAQETARSWPMPRLGRKAKENGEGEEWKKGGKWEEL